jgi:hypothetical protein
MKTGTTRTEGQSILPVSIFTISLSKMPRIPVCWIRQSNLRQNTKITKRTHFHFRPHPIHQQLAIKPYQTSDKNEPTAVSNLKPPVVPSCAQSNPNCFDSSRIYITTVPFSAFRVPRSAFNPVAPNRTIKNIFQTRLHKSTNDYDKTLSHP